MQVAALRQEHAENMFDAYNIGEFNGAVQESLEAIGEAFGSFAESSFSTSQSYFGRNRVCVGLPPAVLDRVEEKFGRASKLGYQIVADSIKNAGNEEKAEEAKAEEAKTDEAKTEDVVLDDSACQHALQIVSMCSALSQIYAGFHVCHSVFDISVVSPDQAAKKLR